MRIGQAVELLEFVAELRAQAFHAVPDHLESTASLGPFGSERSDENVSPSSEGTPKSGDVTTALRLLAEKVKDGAIVPKRVRSGRKLDARDVTNHPPHCAGQGSESGLGSFQSARRDVEHGDVRVGGWLAKNVGGVDASLNCAMSAADAFLPRLSVVTTPFDPVNPGDHFPERRPGGLPACGNGYCDGEIASAALWQVRSGMRSKCRPSGIPVV